MFFPCQTHTKNRSSKKKQLGADSCLKQQRVFLAPTPVLLLVIVIENRLKVKYELKKTAIRTKMEKNHGVWREFKS